MDECIKRKSLLTAICDDMCGLKYTGVCENCRVVALIVDTPAVDVAPVVHGQWIPFHSDVAGDIQYCSACEIGFGAKMDYCPHCGAKMDGGD